jgi:hypothetical protein
MREPTFTVSILAATLLTTLALTPVSAAASDEKCKDDRLAEVLHERMKADGKSDADVRDILDSRFKRGILAGRVADQSGCSEAEVGKALEALEKRVGKS